MFPKCYVTLFQLIFLFYIRQGHRGYNDNILEMKVSEHFSQELFSPPVVAEVLWCA